MDIRTGILRCVIGSDCCKLYANHYDYKET